MSTLIETAYRWCRHARAAGCRFDAERKAAEAVRFTLDLGARSFALPTKLEGVASRQRVLRAIAAERARRRWVPLTLHDAGDQVVAVYEPAKENGAGRALAGFVRPKHHRWLLPLLRMGCVRCYVLDVTGGPPAGHRWFGCNVVLAGIEEALSAYEAQQSAHTTLSPLESGGTLSADRLLAPGDGQATRPPAVRERRFAYAASPRRVGAASSRFIGAA